MIRLLLADDHPVVRKGLRACLARRAHVRVVGEACDGQEAVQKARELLPDMVLMDIDMPGMNGFDAAEVLRRELPGIKVLFLSAYSTPEYAMRVVRSGAQGYLRKDAPAAELMAAIETVAAGNACFSPEVARLVLSQRAGQAGTGEDSMPSEPARSRIGRTPAIHRNGDG